MVVDRKTGEEGVVEVEGWEEVVEVVGVVRVVDLKVLSGLSGGEYCVLMALPDARFIIFLFHVVRICESLSPLLRTQGCAWMVLVADARTDIQAIW